MKKVLLAVAAFVFMSSMSIAQKKEVKATSSEKAKTEKVSPAAKAPAAAAKPAGPTKKDGTPDMRYKANKDAAPKKKG